MSDLAGREAVRTLGVALAMIVSLAGQVSAETGVFLKDGRPSDAAALATGDQLLIENRNDDITFAGRSFAATGFTGVLGYSSELAYVAVISGWVVIDGESVEAGRMVLLPPMGGKAQTELFDAARFSQSWPQAVRETNASAFAALSDVASSQGRAIFFGRLGQTRFNVAAPGSADQEMATRTVKGASAIQNIRFSGQTDLAAIEQQVADDFLAALANRDTQAVAALMDPVPFGNTDLRNGGSEARLAMATALVAERDWAAALREARAVREPEQANNWAVTGPAISGTLTLRPVGDFIFVRTVNLGEQP